MAMPSLVGLVALCWRFAWIGDYANFGLFFGGPGEALRQSGDSI